MTIYDIIAKAESLKTETALDSITPKRVGEILVETLNALNEYQIQSGGLSIQKIYDSISAMQSDLEPISDLTGRPLRRGQLVVIVPADQDDPTAGDVYRYNGSLSWTYVAKIGGSLGESDFFVIESVTLDELYYEYVQHAHEAQFQHQYSEGRELWNAIAAGKKIAIKQSNDYPGYSMAIVANKEDFAYIVCPFWDEGYFVLTMDQGGYIDGVFNGSINAFNLDSYLEQSEKLKELSAKIVPSDWLADTKKEEGYIKNRTHYIKGKLITELGYHDCPSKKIWFKGQVIALPEDGSTVTLATDAGGLYAAYVKGPDKLLVSDSNGYQGYNGYLQSFPIKTVDEIVALGEYYIPDTIARKAELTELSAEVGKKQDTISDLANIREGAAKGATALQSVPATYATKTYVDDAIAAEIDNALTEEY